MESHLDDETVKNIEKIPSDRFDSWGRDGVWSPCDGQYADKTTVTSGETAVDAFEHYTAYYNQVCESWSPSSDTLVLVPCGATKPIGSSTLHQKKVRAVREGGLTEADIVIVSEPCTIVPPEYRLSLPAANYDFPPEFTVKSDYPAVFEVFTDRLANWLDLMDYEMIYPYLISGHQTKFDAALEKMDSTPNVYEIPTASFNADTESYSGDMFKKQADMSRKVAAVRKYKAGVSDVELPKPHDSFYADRWV